MFTALLKVFGFFLNEEDEMPESEDTTFHSDTGYFIFNIVQNKFDEIFFFLEYEFIVRKTCNQ